MPTSSTAATIAALGTYTVTIGKGAVAQSLTIGAAGATAMDTGSLLLTGQLDIAAGQFVLDYGTLTGATVVAGAGGSFLDAGGMLSDSIVDGTLNVMASAYTTLTAVSFAGADGTGLATINLLGSGSQLNCAGAFTLDNAVINLGASLAGISGFTGATLVDSNTASTFTLGAKLVLDQGGLQAIVSSGDVLLNEGTITASTAGGTLILFGQGGIVNDGDITVSNTDTLVLAGNVVTAALINSINVSGGTLDIQGQVTGGTIVSATSNVVADVALDDVTVHGTLTLGDSNGGSIQIIDGISFAGLDGTGNAVLDIGLAGSQGDVLVDNVSSFNDVTINLGHSGTLFIDNPSSIFTLGAQTEISAESYAGELAAEGSIVNNGTINVAAVGADFEIYAAQITNNGAINLSGGGTLEVTGAGSSTFVAGVNVTNGTLRLDTAYTGTTAVSLQAGEVLALDGGGTLSADISGSGTLLLNDSIGYTIKSDISVSATLAAYGVQIALAAGVQLVLGESSTWIGAGNLVGAGHNKLTIEGSLLGGGVFGVNILDAGLIDVATGQAVVFGEDNASATISGTLTGAGTVYVEGSAGLTITPTAHFDIDHVVQSGGTVLMGKGVSHTVAADQSWSLQNAALTGKAGTLFTNDGTFSSTGTAVSTVSLGFANTGQITASSGTLQFLAPISNGGTIVAAGGRLMLAERLSGQGILDIGAVSTQHGSPSISGTVELHGVAASQMIDFIAAGSALLLDSPGSALGHIADFAAGDTITLIGTQETGFSYTNNVLSVFDGTATVAALHFNGSYAQSSFVVGNSSGQIVITHS